MPLHRHPEETIGYWGSPTSTLDWCEENYALNHYIAEFWNTWTNTVYILGGLLFAKQANEAKLPFRYALAYLTFTVVGVGSFAFHATLLYEMQLSDEIPMLFSVSQAVYCLVAKKDRYGVLLILSVILPLISSITYYVYNNPLVHQLLFGILVTLGMYIMRLRVQYNKQARFLALRSLSFLLIAFLIWNVDNFCCHHIRFARSFLKFPIDALLQLHGWWHVLSALSFLYYIAACIVVEFGWIRISLVYGLIPVVINKKQSVE